MHSIDEYILRSQYPGGQGALNSHTYYRFQPHSGTLPLLQQHSHALQLSTGNTNGTDSMALTEMSLVNSGQMEANSYYSASNPTYPPDPSAILHHSQHPPSDLMTNAFTYNVNTSSASTGLYPISSDLVAIANSNSTHHQHQHQHQNQHQHQHQHQRTYTEIGQCNSGGGATELAHHVTTLGPMVGHCLDSLSSSTSDKTAEVEDEWHLPKHHTMMLTRNGPLPHSHSQSSQQPYMSYVRSNEVSWAIF